MGVPKQDDAPECTRPLLNGHLLRAIGLQTALASLVPMGAKAIHTVPVRAKSQGCTVVSRWRDSC